jgi:hypothetical protein
VPKKEVLKKKILDEVHMTKYFIPPGSTKMYHDLREQFWWTRMKRETARYVTECNIYRKVRADYMKARGLLQPFSVLDWKWEDISMDFIMVLPLTARKFDSIWVIIDQFTKYVHFMPVHTRFTVEKYTEIYITHILCFLGVLKVIFSDRGFQFVARF